MTDTGSSLKTDRRKACIRYKSAALAAMDAQINLCESLQQRLVALRDAPEFTRIFSAEEIIEINQVERIIPESVADIRKVKQVFVMLDPESFSSEQFNEVYDFIDVWLQELTNFSETASARIPKTSAVWLLVFQPVWYLTHRTKMFYYEVRNKWTSRKQAKFLAKQRKK